MNLAFLNEIPFEMRLVTKMVEKKEIGFNIIFSTLKMVAAVPTQGYVNTPIRTEIDRLKYD